MGYGNDGRQLSRLPVQFNRNELGVLDLIRQWHSSGYNESTLTSNFYVTEEMAR
jgi:hypothetical protein